ncbi:cytosolic phospholipase A2 zeta [Danio aesculapii]|uniref:cytosolic phospholipase A2 zeta n=1 Tax=Danio aesculapii TaxID=1142201 RepID=UPI0024C08EA0|nr:cytosolic phospholipase A2 zeta [Danio aesculapii]XP_056313195.1 cytosolic phospholipase A2 zeta [Danio aesculapii]
MSTSRLRESEVRIAHSLNRNEEQFVVTRRKAVLQNLARLGIHCSQDKVPNIALLGSGGGQRAMVGLLGSLDQLDKAGLLDCVLYLSGVSGSTWCMASLYQEPDWSTKLQAVKERIVRRLSGPAVSWSDAYAKMKEYYSGKDYFSLTDVWAVLAVTTFVKEIDESTLSDQREQHKKDPFPILTVIDKQCKQCGDGDPWFEISPRETGYSLTGAFVNTPSFCSQFENGSKVKPQPEVDMLYLQALCGSALADGVEMAKFLWEKIKEFFRHLFPVMIERMKRDPNSPPLHKCSQVLMELADMNICVLNGKNPTVLDRSIRIKLNELSGGKRQFIFQVEKLTVPDKRVARKNMNQYTLDVCTYLQDLQFEWPVDIMMWMRICECMALWIWGRNYDFLHNMTDRAIPPALRTSDTRDYEDAGLLLNSPYLSVLRKERNTDLIISLDFSEGDPFMTVRGAAEMCRKQNIPFPQVNIPDQDIKKPKDFYVFKGQNTPTVIHMPLFNVVNCGDKLEDWRTEYTTFQGAYSAQKITDLMNVAGKNISNNRERLMQQIQAVIG